MHTFRYVNRIYGVFDGVEGLLYEVPKKKDAKDRAIYTMIYGCGGVCFHILENMAMVGVPVCVHAYMLAYLLRVLSSRGTYIWRMCKRRDMYTMMYMYIYIYIHVHIC